MHNALQYAIDERNKAVQIAQDATKKIAEMEEQHKAILAKMDYRTLEYSEMFLQQKIEIVNAYNVAIETATIAHDAEKIAERIADKIAITERDEYYKLYEIAEQLKEQYEEAQEKVDTQIAKAQKAAKTTMDIIRSRHDTHEILRQAEHNIQYALSWLDSAKENIKKRFE
jgi:hypothetical protein